MPNYTATIPNLPVYQNGALNVQVLLTPDDNSTPVILDISTGDPASIPLEVQDKIDSLQKAQSAQDFESSFIPNQKVTLPTTTPAPFTPQEQYFQDVETLEELIAHKQAMGIDITTDTDVLALQQVV